MNKVILPCWTIMLEALMSVSRDETMVERFYPRLQKYAETQKNGLGITNMLILELSECYKEYPDVVFMTALPYIPHWIKAICLDPEVRALAIEHYKACTEGGE